MPASFNASMMRRASELLRLNASAAVAPRVVTPKLKEARSGVASTVPSPVTVMTVPAEGVALRPRRGCATPAIAAATRSTPARRRIVRSLFMREIRRDAPCCHTPIRGTLRSRVVDQAQLLKGVLELAVLAVISRGETYGYEILSTLEGAGFDSVGDASVYGTLRRLEQAGHLESRLAASDSGPARKYYSVTPSGAEQLRAGTETWWRINAAFRELVLP